MPIRLWQSFEVLEAQKSVVQIRSLDIILFGKESPLELSNFRQQFFIIVKHRECVRAKYGIFCQKIARLIVLLMLLVDGATSSNHSIRATLT